MVAVLSLICVIPAVYFFIFEREKDTNLSPAESRELNIPCKMLKYYDR